MHHPCSVYERDEQAALLETEALKKPDIIFYFFFLSELTSASEN